MSNKNSKPYYYETINDDYDEIMSYTDVMKMLAKDHTHISCGITLHMRNMVMVDVDVPLSNLEMMNIVESLKYRPTLATQNKESGHWQLQWFFNESVWVRGKTKKGKRFENVEFDEYREVMQFLTDDVANYVEVDRNYRGTFCRNPYHEGQNTIECGEYWNFKDLGRKKVEKFDKYFASYDCSSRHLSLVSELDSWGLKQKNLGEVVDFESMMNHANEIKYQIAEDCNKNDVTPDKEIYDIVMDCLDFVEENWDSSFVGKSKGVQTERSAIWNEQEREEKCEKIRQNINMFKKYFKGKITRRDLEKKFGVVTRTIQRYIKYAKEYLAQVEYWKKKDREMELKMLRKNQTFYIKPSLFFYKNIRKFDLRLTS